jgi:hypothetical protein
MLNKQKRRLGLRVEKKHWGDEKSAEERRCVHSRYQISSLGVKGCRAHLTRENGND